VVRESGAVGDRGAVVNVVALAGKTNEAWDAETGVSPGADWAGEGSHTG